MGCQTSVEADDTIAQLSVLPGQDLSHFTPPEAFCLPTAFDTQAEPESPMVVSSAPLKEEKSTLPSCVLPNQVPGADPPQAASDAAAAQQRFDVPEGWRVVCRLSQNDARAKWGSRPRPAPAARAAGPQSNTHFEADVVLPEMAQPLRVPLQLLPQWIDPQVGIEFVGRYKVMKLVPLEPGLRGKLFQVHDKQEKSDCALRICELNREADVKAFAIRLQLEQLDSDSRLFLKIQDIFISPPAKLVIIEDAPLRSLWQEFERIEPSKQMVTTVVSVANSILTGLGRLHAHGWAHCGVSPFTVCITDHGRWRLSNLDCARRVSTLTVRPLGRTGTATPPEASLGLSVTEKVDVWQLAVALCEAIMRRRLEPAGTQKSNIAELLCLLIDFLGPLPVNIVEKHPRREELFTPEGHILRPTTPGGDCATPSGQLDAIEPLPSPIAPKDVERIPCPLPVKEKLKNIEGAADAIEFLGRLLNPDPEQRPSASEATAHHFLRFAHSKGFVDNEEDDSSPRKGVGFVREANEDKAPREEKATNKVMRKGTGFVAVGELPDSEEEEEDEDPTQPVSIGPGHVRIQEGARGEKEKKEGEGKVTRKGTGFVNLNELPPSDDEDEDEEEAKPGNAQVRIQDAASSQGGGEGSGKMIRKGTGFVHVGELPPSDEEEEEEDEFPRKAKVQLQDSGAGDGDAQNKLARKGTGFVHVGELPPSDDEDEEEAADARKNKVQIQESRENSDARAEGSKLARKGTGFVHVGELPPSDDEDEEEESSVPKGKVTIQDSGSTDEKDKSEKLARKGTGFVNLSELPPSDDEDEEEDEKPAGGGGHVKIADGAGSVGDGGSKLARKGTGFVHIGELPPSDDEEEDDEAIGAAASGGSVKFDAETGGDAKAPIAGQGGKMVRKGTGFVNMNELPPSDDEDEDEEEGGCGGAGGKQVRVAESGDSGGGAGEGNKLARKGTGFVHVGELPPSDDEDEDEEGCAPHKGQVCFDSDASTSSAQQQGQQKVVRKGTGFVALGELPDSEDDEDD